VHVRNVWTMQFLMQVYVADSKQPDIPNYPTYLLSGFHWLPPLLDSPVHSDVHLSTAPT